MSDFSYHINTVILKVAAPCNLNCSYCYEYNRGDDSWKSKPKSISGSTTHAVAKRVAEYALRHGLSEFKFSLHGGEPLLIGAKGIDAVVSEFKSTCSALRLRFGMQTNGTLVTEEIASVLAAHGVSVGVSLDGDVKANRLRIDHQGLGTWDRTVAGIHNLKRAGCFSWNPVGY